MAESYLQSLKQTPKLLKERAFKCISRDELAAQVAATGGMKKVLGAYSVMMVGIGIVLGSGIYVTTGSVANQTAGPAVVMSYVIAGISAMVSGICYAEFAVDYPVAGGSYTYVLATFGELLAWFNVGMMFLQYTLGNAGVARVFSGYLANLFGLRTDFFILGGFVDLWAGALILGFMTMLILGTKESAIFNNVCQVIAVGCVIFVIIMGFVKGDTKNFSPFFGTYGWRGMFNGAAIVFFSYIGFDAICNTAEEVKNPARDLPIGLVGSLSVVTFLYCLAATAIVLLCPYYEIDITAAFAVAFRQAGIPWASYIVSLGACVAIVTGVLVGVMTTPRLVAAAAREGLLPSILDTVHPKYKTPWIATLCTGSLTATVALFTSLDVLLDLTSVCVLTVYALVGAGVLWRRYFLQGEMEEGEVLKVSIHFAAIILLSLCVGVTFVYVESPIACGVFVLVWAAATLSMQIMCKVKYVAPNFSAPVMPWFGAFSVLSNLFLLCTIPSYAFFMYAIFLIVLILIYVLYGVHGATWAAAKHADDEETQELTAADAAEKEGLTKEVEII